MFRSIWNIIPGRLRDFLYNKILSVAHMSESLDIDRLNDKSIKMAIYEISKRFPSDQIYLISDRLSAYKGLVHIGNHFVDKGFGAKYLCIMSSIEKSEEVARLISASKGYYYFPMRAHPPARFFEFDSVALNCLRKSASLPRSHFDSMDYENIIQAISNCLLLEGDIVEIGTFEGRSSQVILNYLTSVGGDKKLYCLDTYCGIVFDSASTSSDAHWYGSHTSQAKNSLDDVRNFISPFGDAVLIKTDITVDEIPACIDKVAFCNLDVDIYEAYIHALHKIHPKMVLGGMILLEDYGHAPYILGAKLALDDFFKEGFRLYYNCFYLNSGQMLLIRVRQ
jgi:hypothetical protein